MSGTAPRNWFSMLVAGTEIASIFSASSAEISVGTNTNT